MIIPLYVEVEDNHQLVQLENLLYRSEEGRPFIEGQPLTGILLEEFEQMILGRRSKHPAQ